MLSAPRVVQTATVAVLALAGCGKTGPTPDATPSPAAVRAIPAPAATRAASESARRKPFRPVTCPPALTSCRTATGRVIYVEAVDPDGDGDAHYVLAGGDITAPGFSVVDVRAGLRPRRLPRPGERVSAAGPVFTGSYGQRQIEAVRIRHDRP